VPLYEYNCARDGRFELIRKFSDPPLEACPTCGSAVEKLLSSPAIQFKGTGWYVTDYARKSNGESGKGEGEGKGESGKGESGKGDAAKADGARTSDSSSSSGSSDTKSTTDSKSTAPAAGKDSKSKSS
jgi:putative FmdB family regulatory protein